MESEGHMTLSQHSAAPALAGYTYQFERAFWWLSKAPSGTRVGIETGDDVAFDHIDGVVLEQDKHTLAEYAEPFGDRSVGLWKTLSIWVQALHTKELEAKETRFLLVTNGTVGTGIASDIGNAKTEQDIDLCVSKLKQAGSNPSKTIKRYVEIVLQPECMSAFRLLVPRCEVLDGTQSTSAHELRSNTISRLQIPEWCGPHGDSIANELYGWIEQAAMKAWREKRPAWIERDHFVNQLHAILDRRKRQMTRERAEHLIQVTEDDVGGQKGSSFVRQLHLITEDESVVDSSIREFIRCNIEKSRLSAEGNVTDNDWLAFEDSLRTRWQKIQRRVIRMRPEVQEQDVGFEIFAETTEEHRERLAGLETEQVYLTSGTYHRLAEMIVIGWHPRYTELMEETNAEYD